MILVVGLPLQLARVIAAPITSAIWMPMLLFEVALALWFIVKGVAPSGRTQPGE